MKRNVSVIMITGDTQLTPLAKGFADFVLIRPFEMAHLFLKVYKYVSEVGFRL